MNAVRPLLAFVAGATLFSGQPWTHTAGVAAVWLGLELLTFTNRARARAASSWARRQQQFPATRVESAAGQEGSTVVGAPGRPPTERALPPWPHEDRARW